MFPTEIWYLILNKLEAREDGDALFTLAQANRTLTSMALPCLYRICFAVTDSQRPQMAPAQNTTRLWRSIILSAEDKTAFPYCLWIENLCFWHLYDTVDSATSYPCDDVYSFFFGGYVEPYIFQSLVDVPQYRKRIIAKAGEIIFRYIEKAAKCGEPAVSLVGLRVTEDLPELLPDWVSRLPMLEQLHVRGSLSLSTEVASAIRDHCPRFRYLAIEADLSNETGVVLDEPGLASFLRTLRPGSLEVFRAVGSNDVANEALGALSAAHASSLKRLELTVCAGAEDPSDDDPRPRMSLHLGALRPCVALERVDLYEWGMPYNMDDGREGALRPCQRFLHNLDPDYGVDPNPEDWTPDWRTAQGPSFVDTAAWLGACASLASLTLFKVPDCGGLLRVVLQSPTLRLRYLHVDAPVQTTEVEDACFLESLHYQTALEGFTFGWHFSSLNVPDSPTHQLLMRSLCQCPQLRDLKLLDTAFTAANLAQLAASLPNLEVLMFDSKKGAALDDTAFEPLLAMPKLKRLCIDGPSSFSTEGMFNYIEAMAAQGRDTEVSFRHRIGPSEELLLEHAQALGVNFDLYGLMF